jgi:hypothetical protein
MIYSIENDFVFLHCPRTSGTAISKALSVLIPDAQFDLLRKHCVYEELPKPLKALRAFTVLRPLRDVRQSYFRHVQKWYRENANGAMSTRWLLEHAQRLGQMSLEQYLASDEPPCSVDGYSHGCDAVFEFGQKPYADIAQFCRVDPKQFCALMDVFRGAAS